MASMITSSIDTMEIVTDACTSSVPSSTNTLASSQKKTKKMKVKAVVAATQAKDDDMNELCVDHAYLGILYKRIRTHRKKLEKIKGLEQAQVNDGKVLNAQQLALMSNKASLEKLVAELEMLREQFVTVYRQELEQKRHQETQMVRIKATTAITKEIGQCNNEDKKMENVKQDEESLEVENEMPVVKEALEQVTVEQPKVDSFANVYELLKALHVVNLHQTLGNEKPMVLDFFSKVLLGNTRPLAELSYEENLLESLEEAQKYLTKSDKVFACDTTYDGLRTFVDNLVSISVKKPNEEAEDKAVAEPTSDTSMSAALAEETSDNPVVPAEINMMPQISFFTESQLESEQGGEGAAEMKVIEVRTERTEGVTIEAQDPKFASAPASPLSFAAEEPSERTPSPATSSGSSGNNDKKEHGLGGNSLVGKNSRRQRQGRWREKGGCSNNGGNRSGTGSPTKPRRSRASRANDEKNDVERYKRSGSKENGRSRVDCGMRKQDNSSQRHIAPIAPRA